MLFVDAFFFKNVQLNVFFILMGGSKKQQKEIHMGLKRHAIE